MLIASSDITIGKNSTLAYRTLLTTNANPNAPYNELCKIYPPIHKEIRIGDNVWVGAGVIVLPGCRIGNNSVIAAGAVVCHDIPDNCMAAGVPAKVKKAADSVDKAETVLQSFFTFEGKGTMIFLMSCKKLFGVDAKMIGWGSAT